MSRYDVEGAERAGRYNRESAEDLGWTLDLLEQTFGHSAPVTYDDLLGFERVQDQLGVNADGWFGPKSYATMMARYYAHHVIVGGFPYAPPKGVAWTNWHHPTGAVAQLPSRPRKGRDVTLAVIHESVTPSAERTVRVLRSRGLGVHLMVRPARSSESGLPAVEQHGDLAWARMAHAEGQNGPGIGIEVVNPYYPESNSRPNIWTDSVDLVRWADDGVDKIRNYLVPTEGQLEALTHVLAWLTERERSTLRIPRTWAGYADGRMAMNRLGRSGVPERDAREPGIWAHTYTHHADGSFPTLYAFLRLERGMPPADAYSAAKAQAANGELFAVVGVTPPSTDCSGGR